MRRCALVFTTLLVSSESIDMTKEEIPYDRAHWGASVWEGMKGIMFGGPLADALPNANPILGQSDLNGTFINAAMGQAQDQWRAHDLNQPAAAMDVKAYERILDQSKAYDEMSKAIAMASIEDMMAPSLGVAGQVPVARPDEGPNVAGEDGVVAEGPVLPSDSVSPRGVPQGFPFGGANPQIINNAPAIVNNGRIPGNGSPWTWEPRNFLGKKNQNQQRFLAP